MGKKHPLDVFRTSTSGFDTASRDRPTLLGRVVASAPRAAPAQAPPPAAPHAGLPPAVAATRERVLAAAAAAPAAPALPREPATLPPAARRPLQPPAVVAPAPERRVPEAPPRREAPVARAPAAAAPRESKPLPAAVNRVLLVSAFALVGGLTLWTLAASFGGPSLKSQTPVTPVASGQFEVRAASWPGTPAGQSSAYSARDLLRQQGFPDASVLTWPGAQPETVDRFDLIVGRAPSQAGLADALKRLKAIKNWPGAVKAPFKDAAVQPVLHQ